MGINDVINSDIETLDDLQNGLFIIQRKDGFRFGIDAVLLSDFARQSRGRGIDLCSGTGIVALLLAAKTRLKHIDAVEIQRLMADMAQRSIDYNKLGGRVFMRCLNLLDAPEVYGKSCFDAVTVNPPYMKAGCGLINSGDMKTISRHEVECTLDDVVRVSADLLKTKGSLYMVHRPSRLADILCCMRKYRIEPKLLRFVAPRQGKEPNMLLVQGIRNAKSDLKLLPQLYVYNNDGGYTKEIDEIYGR